MSRGDFSGQAPRKAGILAVDSCGAETTLALGELAGEDLRILRELSLAPRTAGSLLTTALRDLLNGTPLASLGAIVVVRGPGSFTGMRIGLSAAKALSEAADLPIVGVSRLAVLAERSAGAYVALDAGRGSVYLGTAAGAPELLTAEEVRARLAGAARMLVVCEDKVAALFPTARRVPAPSAADALSHARARVRRCEWDDTATLDALYLWRAEQMLGRPSTT